VRLEGLDKLKNFIHFIGSRTHDLLACSIAPQPSMLPRAHLLILTDENQDVSVRVVGVRARIRTKNLPSTGKERYRYANPSLSFPQPKL
jgi:hypothetical protein